MNSAKNGASVLICLCVSNETRQADSGSSGSLTRPDVQPGSVVFTEPSFCPVCGCELTGQPQLGHCPECGRAHRPGSVVPRRAPSTLSILVRFVWPVALLAGTMFAYQWLQRSGTYISPAEDDFIQLLISVSVIGFLVNLPVQMIWWRRVRGLPSREPKVVRVCVIALVSVMSAVCLVPFLLLGACLVLTL